jgi:gamma-glutamylcyclotransferase (GGCT)/AIG2-like uncharacterized protein YtfP
MCGESNHPVLGEARLVGSARTAPRYRLVDLGPYPALMEEGCCAVSGELYEIDARTLRHLDRFEGHPDLYRRAPVELASGELAIAYFAGDRMLQHQAQVVIEGGDWRSLRRGQPSPCDIHPDRSPAERLRSWHRSKI